MGAGSVQLPLKDDVDRLESLSFEERVGRAIEGPGVESHRLRALRLSNSDSGLNQLLTNTLTLAVGATAMWCT